MKKMKVFGHDIGFGSLRRERCMLPGTGAPGSAKNDTPTLVQAHKHAPESPKL